MVVVVITLCTCVTSKLTERRKNTNLVVLTEGGKTSSGLEFEPIAMPV